MATQRARLLCVGEELDLLHLRCAVLTLAGYDAESVTPDEAIALLRTREFDLVVLSARVPEGERNLVLSVAGEAAILVLTGFTFPEELLSKVEAQLQPKANRGEGVSLR